MLERWAPRMRRSCSWSTPRRNTTTSWPTPVQGRSLMPRFYQPSVQRNRRAWSGTAAGDVQACLERPGGKFCQGKRSPGCRRTTGARGLRGTMPDVVAADLHRSPPGLICLVADPHQALSGHGTHSLGPVCAVSWDSVSALLALNTWLSLVRVVYRAVCDDA
jgi:hypothetical protein